MNAQDKAELLNRTNLAIIEAEEAARHFAKMAEMLREDTTAGRIPSEDRLFDAYEIAAQAMTAGTWAKRYVADLRVDVSDDSGPKRPPMVRNSGD